MKIISNSHWTGRLMKPREGFKPVRWGFGFEAPGRTIRGVAFALGTEMAGKTFRLRLWHRGDAGVHSAFETEIFSTRPLHDDAAIAQPSLHTPITQFHWFALPDLECAPGLYVCELSAPCSEFEQPFGAGISDLEPPWDWQAGWFMVEGRSPRPAKLPAGVAWLIGESCSSQADGQTITASEEGADASGFGLRLPALEIERSGWVTSVAAATISVPRPCSHEALATMSAGIGELRLPFRHAQLLEAPPAVEIRHNPARLVRAGDAADQVIVKYRGWESRYDAISICPTSGRLDFSQGPGRALDPEEYRASVRSGHAPLFSLYTTSESTEAIRVDDWQDLVRHGCEDRHLAWVESCRRKLPQTLKILRSGGSLRLIGYGDSVTSLGGRHPDQMRFANGPYRDNFGYFEQYGDDWREEQAQQAYSTTGGVQHHHLGWNWHLKRTMEQRWPASVEYLNWGLPGTTTGSDEALAEGGSRMPNGSNDRRLETMLGDKPDLVVVAFGTNDVGSGIHTQANLVRIVKAIHASGSEVIILGPCPPNPGWGSRDPMLWMQTYDAILRAARQADVAFVPTLEIFGSGREGALGLSQRSYSAASLGNHPGASELKAVGKLLSSIIP